MFGVQFLNCLPIEVLVVLCEIFCNSIEEEPEVDTPKVRQEIKALEEKRKGVWKKMNNHLKELGYEQKI